MKYAIGVVLLTLLWTSGLSAQESPAKFDFFQEEPVGPAVKGFTLPLGDGDWSMNCYVAWDLDSKHAVVVDPGTRSREVSAFMQSEGLEVKAVLLTHGHGDHVGGLVHLVADFPSVPVYLHRDDHTLAMLTTGPNIAFRDYPGNGRLTLGKLEFEVIFTPGHSPGSVCLRSGDILFSGDTLFFGTIGKAHGNSPAQREANLRREIANIQHKLMTLPALTRVYPGHGSATTIGREKRSNRFLNRHSSVMK